MQVIIGDRLDDYEKAYVYSNYIGQPVKYKDRNAVLDAVYIGSYEISTNWQEGDRRLYNKEYPNWYDAPLILNQLLDISDYHLLGLASILGLGNGKVVIRNEDFARVVDDSYSVQISFNTAYVAMRKNEVLHNANMVLVYQYLRKLGYDLPLFFGIDHWANHRTAIQLELAIKK